MSELRAFAVLEEFENTGGIIFAKHAITARRLGANEYGGGDFQGVSCRRAPWADEFAETGAVPVQLMIAHGWNFECQGCGHRIDSDWLYDTGKELEDVIGTQYSSVFCTPLCEARHNLSRAEAKHRETRWIRRFKKIIRRRFPDVEICDGEYTSPYAYATTVGGRWIIQQVAVSFTFPGAQWGPATLRYNRGYRNERAKPHCSCANGDREAFEQYARASRITPATSPQAPLGLNRENEDG